MSENKMSLKEFAAWTIVRMNEIFKNLIKLSFYTGFFVLLFYFLNYLISKPVSFLYLGGLAVLGFFALLWIDLVVWARRKLGKNHFSSEE